MQLREGAIAIQHRNPRRAELPRGPERYRGVIVNADELARLTAIGTLAVCEKTDRSKLEFASHSSERSNSPVSGRATMESRACTTQPLQPERWRLPDVGERSETPQFIELEPEGLIASLLRAQKCSCCRVARWCARAYSCWGCGGRTGDATASGGCETDLDCKGTRICVQRDPAERRGRCKHAQLRQVELDGSEEASTRFVVVRGPFQSVR